MAYFLCEFGLRTIRIRCLEPMAERDVRSNRARVDQDTHIILSFGRAEVMAEITSVLHSLTFSVIPSLSIIIIYNASSGTFKDKHKDDKKAHICTRVDKPVRSVDQPLRVSRPRRFELCNGGVATCTPSANATP